MKRPSAILIALCAAAGTASAAPAQITILHVNDTHSHLDAWGPKDANLDGTLGGLAKAATVVIAEKTRDPQALFVHGGDFVNGDVFFNEYLGVPELLLLQSLGLDVLAVGNHELQFGPDFLAGVLASAFPNGGVSILGTNLDLTSYPVLGNWITPTVVKQANGVSVGFFALTTPYDPLEQPAPVVIDPDLGSIATNAAADLRAHGAQVVVCVAHLGMALSREVAATAPGIDVIIDAHDHVALATPETVGTTLIVSAGEYYRWVGRLRLSVDAGHVSLVDYALLPVDATVAREPNTKVVVDALELGIEARFGDVYHDPIAWADDPIADDWDPRHAKRDTAIGNLFTDAYREATGTQIAIEAGGFLDEGLPEGTLVPADVFRSMSYGMPVFDPEAGTLVVEPFRLATFRITGADLLAGLELSIYQGGALFPQVSGMRFDFDSSRPALERIVPGTVHVGGRKLDPKRLYTVTANQGLVMFLPRFGIQVQDIQILPETAYGAARALIERRGVIEPEVSGRIRDVADTGRGGRCRLQ